MMKKLFLVRHAKSSWKDVSLADFDRPLNKRGKRDAPFMGALMAELNQIPDLIISSPANRAITTAREFASKLDYPIEKISEHEIIYHGDTSDIIKLIRNINDKYDNLFLFGHNPDLTSLNNFLSNQYIDNIPTAAIAAIEFDVTSWQDVKTESGRHLFFEYPKKYFKK